MDLLSPDCTTMPASRLGYCTTVLQYVTPGGHWEKDARIALYYFLQLHVNLQLPQNEKFNLKKKNSD